MDKTSNPFGEVEDIWFSYADVHTLAENLFQKMRQEDQGPVVMIAIGRGGWTPTRIVAAAFEEARIETLALSISLSYVDVGTPKEHVVMVQGLDEFAQELLVDRITRGHNVWLIDGPYAMGGTVTFAKDYLNTLLKEQGFQDRAIKVGVLHWVTFDHSPNARWRKAATSPPDAFGEKVHSKSKAYVHYPWEHSKLNHDE